MVLQLHFRRSFFAPGKMPRCKGKTDPDRPTDRPRLAFSEGGEGKTGIWGGGDSAVTSLCSGEREGLSREAKGAVVARGQRGDGGRGTGWRRFRRVACRLGKIGFCTRLEEEEEEEEEGMRRKFGGGPGMKRDEEGVFLSCCCWFCFLPKGVDSLSILRTYT